MACDNKIKNTCGDNIYATCVDFEGTLGKNTKIEDSCVTIEETTEDLYEITDEIIEGLDTSELGQNCMTYPLNDGIILTKTVLKVHEEKICELEQKITTLNDLENVDITGWTGLDLSCLNGVCNTPPQTLGELLQVLTENACN